MRPSLEQLHKILQNEAQRGYDNKAVIGGLPKLLGFWEPNARRDNLDPALLADIVARVRAYPDLPEPARAEAVSALVKLIQNAPDAAPAPKAAPRVEPRPPAERRESAPERERAPRPAPRSAPAAPPPPAAPAPTAASVPVEAQKPVETKPALPRPAPRPEASRPRPAPSSQPGDKKRREFDHFHEEPRDPRPRHPLSAGPLKAETPVNTEAGLDAPITVLYGIGAELAKKYERLGIGSLRDLLLYFPRRYDDYSKMKTINRLEYGEECSVIGTIWEAHQRRTRGNTSMLKVVLSDQTGTIELTFFNSGPWLQKELAAGKQIVVSGRVEQYLGRLTFTNPEWEDLDRELLNTGRIVPVYRATEGIKNRHLRKLTKQVVQFWARKQPDPLPGEIVQRAELMGYAEALAQIHFPDTEAQLAAAQHRLAFDELLLLQLGVLRQRQDWQAAGAPALAVADDALQAFVSALPYALTGAQQKALADIRADLAKPVAMNRLLQGDVGSGKTVVAAAAMHIAVQAGAQAALMAPTSILAEQHFRSIAALFERAGGSASAVRLLQGSTSATEKAEIYAGLKSGAVTIVVGTHAIIEDPVEFQNLALAVVDEQHRFGVAQRAALRAKGRNPHLLVTTATPIPRSLALTVFGDLDLSVLDEMPPGRQPIETHLLHATERERGFSYIRAQVQKGHQAFIIFPLVEESEKIEAKAAVEEHERLQKEVFPDLKLGLLHGRLKADEKDEVMQAFRAGEYHILVSTSVVEVGVDVPNATVMLVEGANRFGLATLHQFRGRVGRGEHASLCLLVSDSPNPRLDERLLAMEQSQDGFYLAEKDLEIRGPGDFLGTRQSGFALRSAKLSDVRTIEKARREAHQLFEKDPDLKAPEHQPLAENLAKFWAPGAGDVS